MRSTRSYSHDNALESFDHRHLATEEHHGQSRTDHAASDAGGRRGRRVGRRHRNNPARRRSAGGLGCPRNGSGSAGPRSVSDSFDAVHGRGCGGLRRARQGGAFRRLVRVSGHDLAAGGRCRRSAEHRRKASGDGGLGHGSSRPSYGAVPGRTRQGHGRDAHVRETRREAGADGDHLAAPGLGPDGRRHASILARTGGRHPTARHYPDHRRRRVQRDGAVGAVAD